MIRIGLSLSFGLLALFALSSCSNSQEPHTLRAIANLALAGIGGQDERAAPVAQYDGFLSVSPQLVATTSDPVVGVVLEARDAQALLTPSGLNGNQRTWLSADRASFTFTAGTILVRTSGLGNDLQNADFSQLLAMMASGQRGTAQREHVYLTRDFQQERWVFACNVTPSGRADIRISGRVFSTLKFEESCMYKEEVFTNTYWLDGRSGLIVQSIQWIHPDTGRAYFQVIGN